MKTQEVVCPQITNLEKKAEPKRRIEPMSSCPPTSTTEPNALPLGQTGSLTHTCKVDERPRRLSFSPERTEIVRNHGWPSWFARLFDSRHRRLTQDDTGGLNLAATPCCQSCGQLTRLLSLLQCRPKISLTLFFCLVSSLSIRATAGYWRADRGTEARPLTREICKIERRGGGRPLN